MCGIAGAFSFNDTVSKERLEKSLLKLSHRGPDAQGYVVSESKNCVLGHRRLSIIDLSEGANQPMISSCGRYAMVFNGEIYNYREIREDILKVKDISFKTNSDSEVILEAFSVWGKSFVYKLNGMFAIAIYDSETGILWLFRDRIGIKPIYYYKDDNLFLFASELKGLIVYLKESGIGLSLNKDAVRQYLRLGYIPEPNSIYNEIMKFPSATYAAVAKDGMHMTCYWDIRKKVNPKVLSDEGEAKKQLKELLYSSVEYRLMSDVPYGTFLSGGIDSSVVTAVAQQVNDGPINTFSIGFKEAEYNEAEYAEKVAAHLGTKHHRFTVSYQDAIEKFDGILSSYDEPFADSSAIPTMLVSKLAREHVTMTLSGDGGDEQFMGYGMYNWAERLNNPMLKAFRKPLRWGLSKMNNRYKRVSSLFDYSSSDNLRSHIFSAEQYFFTESELSDVLLGDSKQLLNLEEEPKLARKLSNKEAQAFFDMRYYLKDDLLVKVDRASMHYSLETRVPLLDHRLVEFTLNLNEKLKVRNGETKYLLKQVLYDLVPKQLFDRPKWGFAIPIRKWLLNEMAYLREKYLDEKLMERQGILNATKVKEIEQRYINGEDFLFNKLWAIILLNQWVEEHL